MRLGLLTSGGDCAGLNAVIRAVVKRAVLGHGWQVLGIRQATHGLLSRPVDAVALTPDSVAGILHLGGTVLGTTNRGDPFHYPSDAGPVDRSVEIAAGYRELKLDAMIGVGGDGLFAVDSGDDEEIYYLARSSFRLNGRPHELFMLRHLTFELQRQEVRTWKKVIRVISHELNNSLAPITSLAHSGAELLRRGDHEKLGRIFDTIEERARHLHGFLRGYSSVAKLPVPELEPVEWAPFLSRLQQHYAFERGPIPEAPARFDPAQVEQALINVLKNAHESGSAADAVTLTVRQIGRVVRLEVSDRGPGMSDAVLANALVPFYSTKRTGSGLGLALAREIAEAHGGRIALANREGGGLTVSLTLPVE